MYVRVTQPIKLGKISDTVEDSKFWVPFEENKDEPRNLPTFKHFVLQGCGVLFLGRGRGHLIVNLLEHSA